jgi:hypothetical protein
VPPEARRAQQRRAVEQQVAAVGRQHGSRSPRSGASTPARPGTSRAYRCVPASRAPSAAPAAGGSADAGAAWRSPKCAAAKANGAATRPRTPPAHAVVFGKGEWKVWGRGSAERQRACGPADGHASGCGVRCHFYCSCNVPLKYGCRKATSRSEPMP